MRHSRNVPVLHDLLEQKHEYEVHMQRLHKIRQLRRKSLQENILITEQVRKHKHDDFLNRLLKEDSRIAAENQKLFLKLNSTMAVKARLYTDSAQSTHSARKERRQPAKNRLKQVEVDNRRLFQKIKTTSAFMDSRRVAADYEKTLRIKNRLMKYDRSCELKCQQYASLGRSVNEKIRVHVQSSIPEQASHTIATRNRIASHYRKEDIMRNRIEFRSVGQGQLSNRVLRREVQNAENVFRRDKQATKGFFRTEVKY